MSQRSIPRLWLFKILLRRFPPRLSIRPPLVTQATLAPASRALRACHVTLMPPTRAALQDPLPSICAHATLVSRATGLLALSVLQSVAPTLLHANRRASNRAHATLVIINLNSLAATQLLQRGGYLLSPQTRHPMTCSLLFSRLESLLQWTCSTFRLQHPRC